MSTNGLYTYISKAHSTLAHFNIFFSQYPNFFERCHHEFIDVRAIILKCESATYQHIYQPVHDMRRIIYLVRNDLKVSFIISF